MSSTRRDARVGGAQQAWIKLPLAVLLLSASSMWIATVNGAPAKFDSNESPFPLELQPPLLDDAATAIDSYGNPIETLRPIDTPDGRKVVSAQGLQFEIPTYASGITEIKKPADDLLPPHIGELNNNYKYEIISSSDSNENNNNNNDYDNYNIEDEANAADNNHNNNKNNNNNNKQHDNDADDDNDESVGTHAIKQQTQQQQPQQQSVQQQQQTHIIVNDNNIVRTAKRQRATQMLSVEHEATTAPTASTATATIATTTTTARATLSSNAPHVVANDIGAHVAHVAQLVRQSSTLPQLTHNKRSQNSPTTTTNEANNFYETLLTNTFHYFPNHTTTTDPATTTNNPTNSPLPPLSNGNFNYPNIPQDLVTINRLAAKYKNPILPNIDPIAVALPNNAQTATATSTSTATTTNNAHAPTSTTFTTTVDPTSSVEIEQANLVKLNSIQRQQQQQQQQQQEASEPAPQVLAVDAALPDYLLALNDPDIAGPVAWTPAPNGEALKVIAWDLLPPHKEATSAVPDDQQQASQEPTIITHDHQAPPKRVQGVEDPVTHNIRLSLSTGNAGLGQISGLRAQAGQVSVVDIGSGGGGIESEAEAETERETHGHGTNAHVGSTTPSSTNRFPIRNRGTVHYSTTTTTPRTTTTQATTTTTTTTTTRRPTTTTTTTTKRPTTTTTTTTTRRPTTTRATTTTTTTTAPLDSAYKLPNEEEYAYTLPPWLSGVTDPDLDVAVTFIVPEDNDKYNHTLERDLEPPLEPFVDVKDIQLTPPPTLITSVTAKPKTTAATTTRTPTTTTTTITTSTTRRPTAATTRAYWVRASPTTPTASTFIPSTLNAAPENGEPNILSSRINTNNLAPNHIQTFAHKPKTSLTAATATTLSSTQSSTIPPTQAATPSQVSTVFNTGKWQHPIKSNIATTASTTDTDPITSAEAATGEHNGKPQASRNPFLPKPFERQPATVTPTTPRTTTTTARTTTTTTTTTTPASVEVYKNPFDSATIPPWLLDFDYADVGPGVPYDPNNFRDDNRDNSNNNNNNPILTFKPLQTPQGFSHQTTSITPSSSTSTSITPNTNTATSTTAFSSSFGNAPRVTATSSASPSKVTLSLPSINQQAPVDDNNGQPPLVLIPPADNVETSNDNGNSNQYQPLSLSSRGTLTTSTKTTATTLNAQQPNPSISSTNTNFAAQLESQGEANPSPLSVSGESFPPFQGNDVNIPTATQKFEYTKSDEGKVITTPVQAQGKDTLTNSVFNSGIEASSGSGSTFGISQTSFSSAAAAPTNSSTSTTASVFGSGQVGSSTSSISASGKYTGGFGGPPGLLRPKQTSASTQTPIWVAGDANDYSKTGAKSTLKPTIQGKYTGGFGAPAGVVAPNDRPFIPYRNNQQAGRFGGPPGVLVPFDNVQSGGQ